MAGVPLLPLTQCHLTPLGLSQVLHYRLIFSIISHNLHSCHNRFHVGKTFIRLQTFSKKRLETADLQVHSASRFDRLWCCRSAIFIGTLVISTFSLISSKCTVLDIHQFAIKHCSGPMCAFGSVRICPAGCYDECYISAQPPCSALSLSFGHFCAPDLASVW